MPDEDAPDAATETFGDLPLQPTGSGVADLEIAFEQMKLAEEAGVSDRAPAGSVEDDAAAEAHPS